MMARDVQLQPQLEPYASADQDPLPQPPAYAAEPILDALPYAGAVLDPHGRIVACNAAWRALGASLEHTGKPGLVLPQDEEGDDYPARLRALVGPLAQEACDLARIVQDAIDGDPQGQTVDYRAGALDGRDADQQAIVCPLPDGRVLVQHVPRSEAAASQATALLLALRLEAERARLRRLRQRITTIGRDLHNPLTPLRLELHLLAQGAFGPMTDRQRLAYAIIERSVDRLVQGEAAIMRVAEPASVAIESDLSALAAAAVEFGRTSALKQGVRLALKAPNGLAVRCDPDAVIDVVQQLVARSVDACASGGDVVVRTELRDDEALLMVTDSGAGLSAEALRNAFEPWGGAAPSPRDVDVRLYALRAAIGHLGGRMWAESPGPGRGLTIGLALPAARDE